MMREHVQDAAQCVRSRVLTSEDEQAASVEYGLGTSEYSDETHLTWPMTSGSGSLSSASAYIFSFTMLKEGKRSRKERARNSAYIKR